MFTKRDLQLIAIAARAAAYDHQTHSQRRSLAGSANAELRADHRKIRDEYLALEQRAIAELERELERSS